MSDHVQATHQVIETFRAGLDVGVGATLLAILTKGSPVIVSVCAAVIAVGRVVDIVYTIRLKRRKLNDDRSE